MCSKWQSSRNKNRLLSTLERLEKVPRKTTTFLSFHINLSSLFFSLSHLILIVLWASFTVTRIQSRVRTICSSNRNVLSLCDTEVKCFWRERKTESERASYGRFQFTSYFCLFLLIKSFLFVLFSSVSAATIVSLYHQIRFNKEVDEVGLTQHQFCCEEEEKSGWKGSETATKCFSLAGIFDIRFTVIQL